MLELFIPMASSVIGVSSGLIGSYIIMKRTVSHLKTEVKEELMSEETQQTLAQCGAALAAGAMTQLKWGKPAGGGMKLLGIKVPQQVVDVGVQWLMKQIGINPQGNQPQTENYKNPYG